MKRKTVKSGNNQTSKIVLTKEKINKITRHQIINLEEVLGRDSNGYHLYYEALQTGKDIKPPIKKK